MSFILPNGATFPINKLSDYLQRCFDNKEPIVLHSVKDGIVTEVVLYDPKDPPTYYETFLRDRPTGR